MYSAIWLFANIWFVNVLRAKMPALQFPVIMYSIFTNVSFTYGPLFPTITAGESLIRSLLIGFLTAFGLSTGVNLFIIPVTSRTVVFKEQAGYIGLIRAALKAQTAYLQSLESTDMFSGMEVTEIDPETHEEKKVEAKRSKPKKQSHPAETPQSKALKATVQGLTALHGKLHGDVCLLAMMIGNSLGSVSLTSNVLDTIWQKRNRLGKARRQRHRRNF